MNNISYTIRTIGLDREPGAIGAEALRDLLDALLESARRAVRLVYEGVSVLPGPAPAWLRDAAEFTITALGAGSTVVGLDAPTLAGAHIEGAHHEGAPARGAGTTAITLLARAFAAVASGGEEPGSPDRGLLAAMGAFARVVEGPARLLEIAGAGGVLMTIDRATMEAVRALERRMPAPQAAVVSGTCDVIAELGGRFELLLDDGTRIAGRIDPAHLSVEELRALWRQPVTIQGMVHYTPTGRPRFIQASVMRQREGGEAILSDALGLASAVAEPTTAYRPVDAGPWVRALRGAWPGDEPAEELLAMLREDA